MRWVAELRLRNLIVSILGTLLIATTLQVLTAAPSWAINTGGHIAGHGVETSPDPKSKGAHLLRLQSAAVTAQSTVSSTPCVFYGSGSCATTDSQVWLYINTTFLAGYCTVNFTVDWGDGTTVNLTKTTVFGELAVLLGIHTFANTGGYSIQVTASVQSGTCVFPPYAAQYTYVPTALRSLTGSNLGGGGSPDILPTTCSCGAPVNTDTGEFWHTFTDLAVPGRGMPLDLTRTYSSASASTLGPLGYGWTDAYGMSLSFDSSGNATVHAENSSSVTALVSGSSYYFPTDVLATLVKNGDGTFTFTRRNKSVYIFSAAGKLIEEADRNGYVTSLAYNGKGHLTSVTDPSGRALTFTTTAAGLVSSVTDPAGRVVKYVYDTAKDLIRATNVGGKSWTFTYDSNHLVLTMSDPRGGLTTNTYDTSGRVLTQTDPMGRTTTYAYAGTTGAPSASTTMKDPRGEVTIFRYGSNELSAMVIGNATTSQANWSFQYDASTLGRIYEVDPNGHSISASYDSWGNQLRTIDALGKVTTATYNSFNEPLTVTDPLGITTNFTYDTSGNLLSRTTGIQTTSFTYGDALHPGDVTATMDPDGNTTTYAYDANGDQISVTDPLGHVSTATFDAIGRMLTSTSAKGGVTTKTYDPLGDVLTKADPLGHTTTNTYDADQNRVSTKDPVGNVTKYVFDADNELTTTIRPGNTSTMSAYDADGNVVSSTDAADHVTTNVYDPLNRLASTTDPLGHVTTNTYDLAGNRTGLKNPSGQTTTSKYDAKNELTSLTYSDGVTHAVTYTYDADGRRTSMVDGTGTTTYTYDALGRLTASVNGAGQSTGYGYDPKGQLTSLTYPSGQTVSRAYDASGNLTSVSDWLGNTTSFAYDADGKLNTQTVPSTAPVVDTTGYDAADQIISISDVAGTSTLQGFTYTRNANTLVASVTPSGQASQAYSYDALDQLTKDAKGTYAYAVDGTLTALLGTKPMAYNAGGQIVSAVAGAQTTTYTYDPQGNRVSSTPSTGTATSTTFDQAGVMTGLTRGTTAAAYVYNGDGLRISKTVNGATASFAWNLQSATPLLLSDGTASYVYGPGDLPLEQITASGAVYYHHDQLGSTTMLTNQAGAPVATYTYGSYGKLLTATGTAKNQLRFAGQYQDLESGLYYLQARYYDPTTGQFTSVDPLDALTGQPYSYAAGNPVNRTDPSGLIPWKTIAAVSGVAALAVAVCVLTACIGNAVLLAAADLVVASVSLTATLVVAHQDCGNGWSSDCAAAFSAVVLANVTGALSETRSLIVDLYHEFVSAVYDYGPQSESGTPTWISRPLPLANSCQAGVSYFFPSPTGQEAHAAPNP